MKDARISARATLETGIGTSACLLGHSGESGRILCVINNT